MDILLDFFKETGGLWLEVSPYLLLGILIAGLLHIFLGKELISNQLGKPGLGSIIKATVLGVPLPVCSCGVIPLASSLRKDGAHKSSVLSFLVSTPTTGVDSILATYSLMGPLFAIFRPLGSFISGITLGVLDYFVEGKNENNSPMPKHSHPKIASSFHFKEFLRYSAFEIPQDIGKWLVIGTILGGAIASFIPKELFSQYFSFPFDFLIALVIGIPLYVCATGSIPIAASLMIKGFSPGAALVFLIAGPATNIITLSFVRAKLGKRSFYLYLANIIVTSVMLGLVFNFIWSFLGANPRLVTGAGEMLPFWVKLVCGIILFLLILNALLKKEESILEPSLEISVSDIHCGHCKITLEGKLKDVKGVEKVSVDVDKKVIKIKGKAEKSSVLKAIRDAGYSV